MSEEIAYMNTDGEYGKYIMQDLILPAVHATPEAIAQYERRGNKRIHWIDGNNMGAPFQVNTALYFKANHELMLQIAEEEGPDTPIGKPHVHEVDELICFYGTDPENPYDLGGEVEIWINGEKHLLTKSSLIYVPAGIPHLPLFVNRADRPIFHFNVLMQQDYGFKSQGGTDFSTKE